MGIYLLTTSALIVGSGAYAVVCWAHPFATCRRCAGLGRTFTRILRRSVNCPRCRGTGRRVRWGRRLHTHATRLHDRGTR